jgi:tripartite-type tricarboxylate transporter receptor subunit TctC
MIKRRDALMGGLAASAWWPWPVLAQTGYPDRPIRLIIPFAPGGVYDAICRPWADRMKGLLGTVVPENVGGAGGSVGAALAARAQPDGYTILLGGGGSHVINPAAASRPLYDPVRDFAPIAIIAATGLAIAAHPSVPVTTLPQLIAYAKANPGKLLKSLTGLSDIVHVPYKGAGPALADAVSGHIPLVIPNVTGQVIALHRADKLKLIVATTPARMIALPDLPTAIEVGLAGMIAQNFVGLFAPAGTPKAIIAQIFRATRTAMAEPAFRDLLIQSGFEPQVDSTPEAAQRMVDEEIARWTPVIKAVRLKLD